MIVIRISYEQDRELNMIIKQLEKVSEIKKFKCKRDCSAKLKKAYVSLELKNDIVL